THGAVRTITTEPSPVPVKGKLTVKVTVDAPGFENREVRVRLFIEDQEVSLLEGDKAKLPLTAGNEVTAVCDAPARPGEYKVTLKIDPLDGELTTFNNEISTFVTVSKEGLSVLYVDKPREERAYIIRALAPDPRIRVDRATLGDEKADPAAGDLFHLKDRAYDVFIIGDVTAAQVEAASPGAAEEIRKLV